MIIAQRDHPCFPQILISKLLLHLTSFLPSFNSTVMSTDLVQAMSKTHLADLPSSSNADSSSDPPHDGNSSQLLTVDYEFDHDEQKTPLPSPRSRTTPKAHNTIAFPTGSPRPTSAILFPAETGDGADNDARKSGDSQYAFVPALRSILPIPTDDDAHNDTNATAPVRPSLPTSQSYSAATLPTSRPLFPPFRSSYDIFDVKALSARYRELRAQKAEAHPVEQKTVSECASSSSRKASASASESGSSYEPSSWTSDGSSFRERVAAKLQARRKEQAENKEKNTPSDVVTLYNDMLTETYSVSDMLGLGAFGRVMYAMSEDGEEVAIKVVHKAMVYRRSSGRDRIINELYALKRATNADLSFVCPMLSAWADEDNIYIVMPCLRENMLQRMEREPLTENDVLLYSAEIVHAVENLHQAGIVHRDIKLENIVLDAHGHVAITDFGLARITETDDQGVGDLCMYDVAGTAGYWAPEVVTVTSKHGYSWQVDIWAMGMVIFEMATNRTTSFYSAKTTAEIKRMMMLHNIPLEEVEDGQLRHLLTYMLVRDPKRRRPSDWLKRHPYFNSIDWNALAAKDYELPPSQFSDVDTGRSGMRFSTFRSGRDPRFPRMALTPDGEIVHNSYALKAFELDDEEPDAYSFSMKRGYRKELMREFTKREGVYFHSRYAPADAQEADLDIEAHVPPGSPGSDGIIDDE